MNFSPLLFVLVVVFRFHVASSSALTPPIALPLNPLCFPNTVAPLVLPTEYMSCASEVKAAQNVTYWNMGKTVDQIILHYGYSLEVHPVNTSDGYILTVFRITGGQVSPPRQGKPTVFMHHGMGGSSDNWFVQPGNRNLAFKLSDAGYDVWVTNCRGTTYSLGHQTLNSSTDVQYWDFSFHDIAMYDIPATLSMITNVTGNEQLIYVGHSMGTQVYMAALSEMPELNSKISAGFLLAPVAFTGHTTNVLRYTSPLLAYGGMYLADPVLQGRIDQQYKFQRLFNRSIGDMCEPTAARCGVCNNVFMALFGFDAPETNYTTLPYAISTFPNIISVKTLVHASQSMNTCQFRQFDYGPLENPQRYNDSIVPPAYNLSRVTAPTYLFHGDQDNLVVPQDVGITQSHLLPTTVRGSFRVNWKLFTHMDFVIAKNADTLLYNQMLQLMTGYASPSP